MPEGDTIRRLADRIRDRFPGQRCERCITRDPRLVGVDFTGSRLVDADALGKHLMIRFDDGRTLHARLRMTGSWTVGPASNEAAWRRRVELWMEDGRLTGLDVPILGVVATAREATLVGHLGPDLCGDEPPDIDDVTARLHRGASEPLAGALVDQCNVAGFGNLYAVELPFVVGVSPNQAIGTVDELDALVGIGIAMIRTNARRAPQNTTGRRIATDDHWIYGKRGRPCPSAVPVSTGGPRARVRGVGCRRGALRASQPKRGEPSTSNASDVSWRSTLPVVRPHSRPDTAGDPPLVGSRLRRRLNRRHVGGLTLTLRAGGRHPLARKGRL